MDKLFNLKRIEKQYINLEDKTFYAFSNYNGRNGIPVIPCLWQKSVKEYIVVREGIINSSDEYVDCFILDNKPNQTFFLALVEEELQSESVSFFRKRHVIKTLKEEYNLSEKEIVKYYLKKSGLGAKINSVPLIIETEKLSESINSLLNAGIINVEMAFYLDRLESRDADNLVNFLSNFHLGANRQKDLILLLGDISKIEELSVSDILDQFKFITDDNKRTETQKLELVFRKLRQLKFPGYSHALEQFNTRARILIKGSKLKINPLENFESPGFEVSAQIKNKEDLLKVIDTLSVVSESDLLSLFDNSFFKE